MAKTGSIKKKRIHVDPTKDPRVELLVEAWRSLDKFQRGVAICDLRKQYTLKQLEAVLPCTEKRIRDFEMFGQTPLEDRPKLARYGVKKLMAWARKRRKFHRELKRLSKGKPARQLKDRLTRTLLTWLKKNLSPWTWDAFLEQVIIPSFADPVLLKYRATWWECDPRESHWENIIEETRPARDPETPYLGIHTDALFDYELEWFARWYQRCIPIPRIAHSVLQRTRNIVREELKRKGRGEDWYVPF